MGFVVTYMDRKDNSQSIATGLRVTSKCKYLVLMVTNKLANRDWASLVNDYWP